MSTEAAIESINDAQQSLNNALEALNSTTPDDPIRTPDEFERAVSAAVPGTVLTLATTFRYFAPLTIDQNFISFKSEFNWLGRMERGVPCPTFSGGVRSFGGAQLFKGIEFTNQSLRDILVLQGQLVHIDGCRCLGDPIKGTKRGIAANARDVTIINSLIDDCFGPYPGQDTQAIIMWDSPGSLTIENCYLSAGSETVMIGGADPTSHVIPSNIVIRNNVITKNMVWKDALIGVKNVFELKNASQVLFTGNDVSYSWGKHGQDGYLLMLTPRNQDGKAPWSTVENVVISNNHFHDGAAAISILGIDNLQTSGELNNITIDSNTFDGLDSVKYVGSQKMIQLIAGPRNVAITNNKFSGLGMTSQVYFDAKLVSNIPERKCKALTITGNTWPKTKYGIFGTAASVGTDPNGLPKAWNMYVESGTLADNKEVS
jgi:Right handed beta helix region